MSPRRIQRDASTPWFFGDPHATRSPDFEPRVVAGIDEAGLGPLLGPLTIGCSAFRVPAGTSDLWKGLESVCARVIEHESVRLVVADSKVVFDRTPRGALRLESTVLAFDALTRPQRRVATGAHDFLSATPSALRSSALLSEPWYAHLGARLSVECRDCALESVIALLAQAMERASVTIAALGVRAVPAPELNASFAETANKSSTHWQESSRWIAHLWSLFGCEGLEVFVDRLGGRMRYKPLLQSLFPTAIVDIVRELPALSEYTLVDGDGRRMRVVFAEKCESLSFAVALASCLAKYARELCMNAFNAYFATFQTGLAPTAGYTTDARRWLVDAVPAIERSGLARRALVRER